MFLNQLSDANHVDCSFFRCSMRLRTCLIHHPGIQMSHMNKNTKYIVPQTELKILNYYNSANRDCFILQRDASTTSKFILL